MYKNTPKINGTPNIQNPQICLVTSLIATLPFVTMWRPRCNILKCSTSKRLFNAITLNPICPVIVNKQTNSLLEKRMSSASVSNWINPARAAISVDAKWPNGHWRRKAIASRYMDCMPGRRPPNEPPPPPPFYLTVIMGSCRTSPHYRIDLDERKQCRDVTEWQRPVFITTAVNKGKKQRHWCLCSTKQFNRASIASAAAVSHLHHLHSSTSPLA